MTKLQYRYTGSHVQDFEVDGKVLMIGPGDPIELDLDSDDKQYAYLSEGGLLLNMGAAKTSAPSAPGGDK